MANLKIKSWGVAHNYGDDFDTEKGPPNAEDFFLEVRIDVEEEGKIGITNYLLFVCTPLSLPANFSKIANHIAAYSNKSRRCIFGKGLLILSTYEINLIEEVIVNEVDNLAHYAIDMS